MGVAGVSWLNGQRVLRSSRCQRHTDCSLLEVLDKGRRLDHVTGRTAQLCSVRSLRSHWPEIRHVLALRPVSTISSEIVHGNLKLRIKAETKKNRICWRRDSVRGALWFKSHAANGDNACRGTLVAWPCRVKRLEGVKEDRCSG